MTMLTPEQKAERLLRLPWTVTSEPADDPGEFIVRVAELPGMIVVGSAEEIDAEFWDALRTTILCYLEAGEDVPLPAKANGYPWERRKTPRAQDLGIIQVDRSNRWKMRTGDTELSERATVVPA